jgi:(5-formylfuran-3-yl)methyl phosphate synthase
MAELLVSVRSADETQAALQGGASIIDVKEPALGSLGRASAETIASVVKRVAGQVPVSVALGELDEISERPELSEHLGLQKINYVKWGLAKSGPDWPRRLIQTARDHAILNPAYVPVAVAYADWQQAQAPPPDAVWAFVQEQAWPVFLLDTWKKDGQTLLDWLSLEEIRRLCHQCHLKSIRVALAGSLGMDHIRTLLPLEPDIVAVRGAACRQNERSGPVDSSRVRRLADLLISVKKEPRTK